MTAIRIFTDEDVYAAVVVALRRERIDAVATPEVGRLGASDDSQLLWSTGENRVLVSFNVAHFAALHASWIRQGRHHAGIVVSSQISVGEVVRRLLRLTQTLDAAALQDRIEFLSDWGV